MNDDTGKIEHISRSVPRWVLENEARRRAWRACQTAASQAAAAGDEIAITFRHLSRVLEAKLRGAP